VIACIGGVVSYLRPSHSDKGYDGFCDGAIRVLFRSALVLLITSQLLVSLRAFLAFVFPPEGRGAIGLRQGRCRISFFSPVNEMISGLNGPVKYLLLGIAQILCVPLRLLCDEGVVDGHHGWRRGGGLQSLDATVSTGLI
jgi:hypothetical protein